MLYFINQSKNIRVSDIVITFKRYTRDFRVALKSPQNSIYKKR